MRIKLQSINLKVLSMVLAFGFIFFPISKSHAGDTTSITIQKKAIEPVDESDHFYIGYPKALKSARILNNNSLVDAMLKANIIPYNNNYNYATVIDGISCQYQPGSYSFFCNKGTVKCRFYTTTSNLEDIDNVIVVIGGTGSRNRGEDLSNVSLSSNSVIVMCYSGSSEINMIDCASAVAYLTKFVDYVFLNDKNIRCNSIVGTSEGAQTAFVTVANNPGLYQTIVCSNGSAYWNQGRSSLISKYASVNGYSGFKDMEIIFLESKNNKYWNPSIVQTFHDLIKSGVSKENINFYTNDREFLNSIKPMLDKDNFHFLSEIEAGKYGDWSKHGDGMKMITDSNILSYLSNTNHTAQYQVECNYIKEKDNKGRK